MHVSGEVVVIEERALLTGIDRCRRLRMGVLAKSLRSIQLLFSSAWRIFGRGTLRGNSTRSRVEQGRLRVRLMEGATGILVALAFSAPGLKDWVSGRKIVGRAAGSRNIKHKLLEAMNDRDS